MIEEREQKLPKWAQKKFGEMRQRISDLERMREAHAVLSNREWFTISGPGVNNIYDKEWDVRKLFFLCEDGAHPACSLYYKDILLVGRSLERAPWAKKAL